jgi:hypothetical protein
MELGRRVSFPRGFKVAARHETRCQSATARRFSVAIYWLAELAV